MKIRPMETFEAKETRGNRDDRHDGNNPPPDPPRATPENFETPGAWPQGFCLRSVAGKWLQQASEFGQRERRDLSTAPLTCPVRKGQCAIRERRALIQRGSRVSRCCISSHCREWLSDFGAPIRVLLILGRFETVCARSIAGYLDHVPNSLNWFVGATALVALLVASFGPSAVAGPAEDIAKAVSAGSNSSNPNKPRRGTGSLRTTTSASPRCAPSP